MKSGAEQYTSVLIRVQARCGKFLGPGVHYAKVTVLDGDHILFEDRPKKGQDSGVVDVTTNGPYPASASPNAILVEKTQGGPPAGAYWLKPNIGETAYVVATFSLAKPTLLEFRATTLFSDTNVITTSTKMWVMPGMTLRTEPGFLLEIPGLVVTLPQPVVTGKQVQVTANVTMMCGCPITTPTWPEQSNGPEPFWPEPEFAVSGVLSPGVGNSVPLTFTFEKENTFTANATLPFGGVWTLGVHAVQPSQNNVGYAETTIVVPG